eukprot:scaffold3082_cov119-Isochrysis_galbana.AAC.10
MSAATRPHEPRDTSPRASGCAPVLGADLAPVPCQPPRAAGRNGVKRHSAVPNGSLRSAAAHPGKRCGESACRDRARALMQPSSPIRSSRSTKKWRSRLGSGGSWRWASASRERTPPLVVSSNISARLVCNGWEGWGARRLGVGERESI